MKRITLCLSLLTFIAGVLLALGSERIYLASHANQAPSVHPAQSNLSGEMELEFIRFISNSEHTYAQFKVTNGSSETVRYPGYATNSNCAIFIKQDGLVKLGDNTWGTHNFGTQELLAGETFINDVRIPEGKGAFEIGFAYEVGADHLWKIVWSEKIELPAK